jgi:hypothetical protein
MLYENLDNRQSKAEDKMVDKFKLLESHKVQIEKLENMVANYRTEIIEAKKQILRLDE